MLGVLRFAASEAKLEQVRSCLKSRLGSGSRGVGGKLFPSDGRQRDGRGLEEPGGARKPRGKVPRRSEGRQPFTVCVFSAE